MEKIFRKIGLLDHMGYGNMGDAAVQESFIANIKRRLPDARLVAFSLYPEDTKKRHNITTYPIRWCYPGWQGPVTLSTGGGERPSRFKSHVSRFRALYAFAKRIHDFFHELAHLVRSYRLVRSLDLLIVSGGGQLCELHGDLPYNVFKFCLLARLAKTPVIIVGVGADLLRRPLNRLFARWSVRLASYTSVRSVESRDLLCSLGVKGPVDVCPDPAYALDVRHYIAADSSKTLTTVEANALLRALGFKPEVYTTPHHAWAVDTPDHLSTAPPSRLKVGLNPMAFCDPRHWPRKDYAVYSRYLDKLTAFSEWLLCQNYRLEVFTSDVAGDLEAIEDLKSRLLSSVSSETAARVSFRPALTLRELFLQMSSFDFVVTSKFHGVIFSHVLEKPVIALSYLPKIDHLMETVGHDHYCMNVEDFQLSALIERFESLVQDGDRLRSLFRKTSAAYAGALQVHFDDLFLANTWSSTRDGRCNGTFAAKPSQVSDVLGQ